MSNETKLRNEIYSMIKRLFDKRTESNLVSGRDYLRYAGNVFDYNEIIAALDSLLDGWLGVGDKTKEFEKQFSLFNNVKESLVTNSGSSANLLAMSTFCSPEMANPCSSGDEIITTASTFPTTLNPIIQNNLIPVLLDVEIGYYNINTNLIAKAITPRTKGIMLAHVLGNPNDMDIIMQIAQENDLFVIEDCCDALGSRYKNKSMGSWGNLATCSFYPAHHMTMGEGGAVFTDDKRILRVTRSLRDWGRACFCDHDEKNPNGACNRRFDYEIDGVKIDHRYLYSNVGYNLKPIELQCAMGLEQLKKLPDFIKKRKSNFKILYEELESLDADLILPQSKAGSDVSWFAFPITIRESSQVQRNDLMKHLEENKIQARILFAGNILKHPGYQKIQSKVIGELKNSDLIMKNTFFVGVYPRLSEENMIYIADTLKHYIKANSHR